MDESRYQTIPETDELVEMHRETLESTTFVATERREITTSFQEGEQEERTIRWGETGVLVEVPDGESQWYGTNRKITPDRHLYTPDGVEAPIIDSSDVRTIGEFETERVAVDEAERTYVFESTENAEETMGEVEGGTVTSADLRIAIEESGYIKSIDYSIALEDPDDPDRTATISYEYEISSVGDVTVSQPSFVEDVRRVEGTMADDRSYIRLEHLGGPTASAGTGLWVQDDGTFSETEFSSDFAPGDRAYVYWVPSDETADGKAVVSVGEQPSSTFRPFEFGDRDPSVSSDIPTFAVAFDEPPADSDDDSSQGETGGEPADPSTNVGGWPQIGRDAQFTSLSSQTLPTARPDSIWSFDASNQLTGPPIVADGRAFVSTDAGSLYAIDAATGDQLWSYYSVGEDQRMYREYQPLVIDDTVFTIGGSGHLHAVDVATGTNVWTYGDAAVDTPPVQINGRVAVTTDAPAAVEIDPASGDVAEMAERVSLPFPPSTGDTGSSWWVSEDRWFGSRNISLSSQSEFVRPEGEILTPVAFRQGGLYIGASNGVIGYYNQSEWLTERTDLVRAKPAVGEENVYTADMSGICVALDRQNGSEQWRQSIDGTVLNNPVVGGDTVVFRTRSGALHALDTSTGEPRWSIDARGGESDGWGDFTVHADAITTAEGWFYHADERAVRGYRVE